MNSAPDALKEIIIQADRKFSGVISPSPPGEGFRVRWHKNFIHLFIFYYFYIFLVTH